MSISIYTDGSYLNTNSTAGFGVYSPDHIALCACGPGEEVRNSGVAEYLAIEVALILILAYRSSATMVTIYTDYQAAVDAYERGSIYKPRGTDEQLHRIAILLDLCTKNRIEITFFKVKGHSGVAGNVIADRLAYLGRVYRLGTRSTGFEYCLSVLATHFNVCIPGSRTCSDLARSGLSTHLAEGIMRPRDLQAAGSTAQDHSNRWTHSNWEYRWYRLCVRRALGYMATTACRVRERVSGCTKGMATLICLYTI